MNISELLPLVKKELENSKADNITELDIKPLSNYLDVMLICTATSTRHAQSISKKLINALLENKVHVLGVEGEMAGEWILIDLGDMVVHVMVKAQRDLYQLEKLWTVTERFKKGVRSEE